MGENTIASVAKDKTVCTKISVTLPTSLVAGDNWVGAIVDANTSIQEEDETNNSSGVKFTNLAPDLIISALRGIPKAAAGGSARPARRGCRRPPGPEGRCRRA